MVHDHSHHHMDMPVTSDPLSVAAFLATLGFSFFASFHCAGMCAPLVHATLQGNATPRRLPVWLYNFGRLLGYTSTGAVLGALHQTLSAFASEVGKGLAVALSAFIMLVALLHLLGRLNFSENILPRFLQRVMSRATGRLLKAPPHLRALLLGMVTVFLPCMTLTPALASAASSESWLHGSLTMLAFFLGTLPAMVFAPAMPTLLLRSVPLKVVQPLSAALLFLSGIVTFLRIYH